MRALAHASRSFEVPDQTYAVVGDLLAASRSLRQVLDQVADAHLIHRGRARDDDGHRAPGLLAALSAADELHEAGTLLDQVELHLDAALRESGRIAWHPQPLEVEVPVSRWVLIELLDGEDADEVMELLHRDGTQAAIEHLAQWDYGEETTNAALANGHVYDEPPFGPLDRRGSHGVYTLIYSGASGHVGLYRQAAAIAASTSPSRETPLAKEAQTARAARGPQQRATDRSWFSPAGDSIVTQPRGRSL
ncbi:hypothetical protein [Aeromicrobium piscarium]|uniref:hypothetical protein n=1 Tax=Aeromicrobium piscarium TaxID=2590901 RepID=UPI001C8F5C48|nr:hypothetical protein [Aeromicrobium piscarium]